MYGSTCTASAGLLDKGCNVSYVTYTTTTRVTDRLHRTDAQADARIAAQTGLSKTGDIEVPFDAIMGEWVVNADGDEVLEPDLTDAQTVAIYRAQHRALVKAQEKAFEGIWGASSDNPKWKTYVGWLDMQARAGNVDANFTDATKRQWLLDEASIPGDVWYDLHQEAAWNAYVILPGGGGNSRTAANVQFWNTSGSTTTSDSRGGTLRSTVGMERSTTFSYIHYLRGF